MNITKVEMRQRLLEVQQYPLTVITAPIGYGKSTVARHMSKELAVVVEWYDDTEIKWYPEECYTQSTWVVLDDYDQYLEDEQYRQEFLEIVYRQKEHLHIVLLVRNIPALPLKALELRRVCQVIQGEELKFGETEIRACFERLGLEVSQGEVEHLEAYVWGWPAAIRLIAERYKKYRTVYDRHAVYGLLYDGIYRNYGPAYQKLLLFLGGIEEFALSDFEQLESYHQIRSAVEQLLSHNIMMQYNPLTDTYKFMPVLSEFLQDRMYLLEGSECQRLYRFIADWYRRKGQWERMMNYLMKAQAYREILELLAQEESTWFNEIESEAVDYLIEKIEESVWQLYPIAHLRVIYHKLQSMTREMSEGWLDQLEAGYGERHELDLELHNRIKGELCIFRARMVAREPKMMWQYLDQAMGYIPKGSIILRSIDYIEPKGICSAYLYHIQPGKYDEETCEMQEKIKAYPYVVTSYSVEIQYLLMAEYAMHTGQWEVARKHARKAYCAADMLKCYRLRIWAHLLLARIALGEGNTVLYQRELESIQKDEAYHEDPHTRETRRVGMTYIISVSGQDISDISSVGMDEVLKMRSPKNDYTSLYLANNTYYLRKKEYIRLAVLLDVMGEWALAERKIFAQIYYYIFKAILATYYEQDEEAIQAVRQAVGLASPDGIILPFREFGKELAPILVCMKGENGVEEIAKQVEEHMCQEVTRTNRWGLTDREWQIAQMIKDGLTNKEIAQELCVAYVTIAKTTSSIYKKIGVSNRVEMVRKLSL